MPVVKLNLAQIEEVGDLIGMSYKKYKVVSKTTGESKWVAEQALTYLLNTGEYDLTEEVITDMAEPKWIAGLGDEGVLILDDFTRSNPTIMQAIMELLDRGQCFSWELPIGWSIICSSNPEGDTKYNVTELDDAQRSRMMHITMRFDLSCWSKWAEGSGLISDIGLNFAVSNEELFFDSSSSSKKGVNVEPVNPRAFTNFLIQVSKIQGNFESAAVLNFINVLGKGSIGDNATARFIDFINNAYHKLKPISELLTMSPKEAVSYLYKEVGDKNNNNHKTVLAVIYAIRIANYCLVNDNAMSDANWDVIKEIVSSAQGKYPFLPEDALNTLITRLTSETTNYIKKGHTLLASKQVFL